MKKNYVSYISFLLIFSFSLITINYDSFNKKNTDISINVSSNNIEKNIYLTFDDGPSENTIKILNILDKYQITATFFVVHTTYKNKDVLVRQINDLGHTLAIHSYTHNYGEIYTSNEAYLNDFQLCENWLKNITKSSSYLYRFPGGSSNTIASKSLIQEIIVSIDKLGYKHVDWNVDALDSKYINDSQSIINKILSDIHYNEAHNIYNHIVLMHDDTKKVGILKALPTIIEYGISNGYRFKTLNIHSYLIQHVKKPI